MKGLLFSEPMVKAWMEGNKTVTRRLMNPQPDTDGFTWGCVGGQGFGFIFGNKVFKPRYLPGETVYIKETWMDLVKTPVMGAGAEKYEGLKVWYRADNRGDMEVSGRWKSPRFMPEWASRSHARIVSVRPERIRDITEEEAKREGIPSSCKFYERPYDGVCLLCDIEQKGCLTREGFLGLWGSLHPGTWDQNPWVWRIELEKV